DHDADELPDLELPDVEARAVARVHHVEDRLDEAGDDPVDDLLDRDAEADPDRDRQRVRLPQELGELGEEPAGPGLRVGARARGRVRVHGRLLKGGNRRPSLPATRPGFTPPPATPRPPGERAPACRRGSASPRAAATSPRTRAGRS